MRHCTPILLTAFLFACQDAPPTGPGTDPEVGRESARHQVAGSNITSVNLVFSVAVDVDGSGRAVGYKNTNTGARGAFWAPTTPRGTTGSLTILTSSPGDTYAWGLNEQGEIAGGSTDGTPTLHAKVWNNGILHSLGDPAGTRESFAEDIGDLQPSGERLVIGRSDAGASSGPTVWRVSGTGSSFAVVGVTPLPGLRADGAGQAISLNFSGLIVGDALNDAGDAKPTKWTPSGTSWSITALGLLPGQTYGQAFGVNASGDAVGFNGPGTPGCTRGVVWPANTLTPQPLQDLAGGFCTMAWSINTAGQITGSARDGHGRNQAVLWLPTGSGGYSLLLLGNPRGASQSEGRALNDPQAGSTGVMELEVVGTSGSAATLWKVKLP